MTGKLYLCAWAVGIALACAALPGLRADANPAKPFLGTWRAEYGGKAYAIVKITDGPQLSGSIASGSITADHNGKVIGVDSEASSESPLLEVKVSGGKLQFKSRDGADLMEYEMTLTGRKQAELKIAGAPVRPFVLTRTSR